MAHIPFRDRPTCTIAEACEASGLGRTTIKKALKIGDLVGVRKGARHLVLVPSLLAYLQPASPER